MRAESTSHRPVCSVVVAAHNSARTIGATLDSVLAQNRSEFEVIVVDDGSTDDTVAVVEPYLSDQRFRLHRQRKLGPAAARNVGIALSQGDYVSMLDSDDLWLPEYLERMTDALERSPGAGFAFTTSWIYDDGAGRIRRYVRHPPREASTSQSAFLAALIRDNFVSNSVTVRRQVLWQVGGFDPKLLASEDYDLYLRIVARGYAAVYVEGPLWVWRDRPGALTDDSSRMLTGLDRTLLKAVANPHMPTRARVVARARSIRVERQLSLLGHPPPSVKVRRVVADATRGVRRRRACRRRPPAEVAAAFPFLATGARRPDLQLPEQREGGAVAAAPRNLAGTVVRGATISGVGYAVAQAISLATYLALGRLLRPVDFGVFAAATVLVNLGLVVGESGMLAALIQRRDRLEEAFNTAFLATLAGGTLLAIAGVICAPVVGLVFHSFRTALIAGAMSAWSLLRLSVIVPNAWLQRNFSFMRRGLIDPLAGLAFAAGAIAAAIAGLGAWSLVIGTYAFALVDVAAAWGLAGWSPRPRAATRAMWRELARFGRPVFGSNLISRAGTQVPVVLIGRLLGAGMLGQFSYGMRVAAQPAAAIVDVGAYVVLPAFARIAPDDARFKAGLLRALRWTCAISFSLGLLLVPLGMPAVVLVFGAKWRLAGYAVMALGVWSALRALDSIASEAWKAAARPDMLPRMHALSLLLTIVFVGALAPLGLIPATIGVAAAAVGVAIYAVHGISKVVGIAHERLAREIWPPAAAAVVMAGVLFATERLLVHADRHPTFVGITLLVIEAMLGLLIFAGCLSALSPACRHEVGGLRIRRQGRIAQVA